MKFSFLLAVCVVFVVVNLRALQVSANEDSSPAMATLHGSAYSAPASVLCAADARFLISMHEVIMTAGSPGAMKRASDSIKADIDTACNKVKTSGEVVKAFTTSCLAKCQVLKIPMQACLASCRMSATRAELYLEGYVAGGSQCLQTPPGQKRVKGAKTGA